MKASNKNIPALRFRGFEGEWINRSFDDVVDIIDCKHRTPKYVEEGIPVVSPGSIKWGEIDLVTPNKRVTDKEYKSLMDHCVPKIGDLVFSRNQSIGVASFLSNNEKFVLGQDTVLIQAKKINSIFSYYRLQTDSVQTKISKLSGGSTFSRINLKDLRKLKVIILDDQIEQQKIASFLSAIDEKIQKLTRKKELLEQYKKGVMQQLFCLHYDSIDLSDNHDDQFNHGNQKNHSKSQFRPLRFKDENGKAYPKWEEKKLGDVLDYLQPTKYLVESTEYDDSYLTPVLTAGKTFILGYTNETTNIYSESLPVILFDDFTTATQFVNFPFKAKSSAMKILVPKEKANIVFVYEAMQLIKFEIGGHGRHWISQFSLMNIPYPCLEEQQKIANYLSSIDTKIETITIQITKTQTFKKGLLQQMFV